MYRLLCMEFRRLFREKLLWLSGAGCVAAIAFFSAFLVKFTGDDVAPELAWMVFREYPYSSSLILSAFVYIFMSPEYREGIIRNKIAKGAERFDMILSMSVAMVTFAAILQLFYSVLSVALVYLLFHVISLTLAEWMLYTLLFMGAEGTAVLFCVVVIYILGERKFASSAGSWILLVLFYLQGRIVKELYPASGRSALSKGTYLVYRFMDEFVPTSYLNGRLRYPVSSAVLSFLGTTVLLLFTGYVLFKRKDICH